MISIIVLIFIEKGDGKMDYVIKNHKNVYIRLNEKGKAITCGEHNKMLFKYSKAKNIVDNLQKTLKRLNFKVEPISDIDIKTSNRIIQKENCVLPNEIIQWEEKFKLCANVFKEAQERQVELTKKLSNIEKAFIDMMHEIEFEGSIDLYGAWKERNRIKKNREERRNIKDELTFISKILDMDFKNLNISDIDEMILRLKNRKYTYRAVADEDTNQFAVLAFTLHIIVACGLPLMAFGTDG